MSITVELELPAAESARHLNRADLTFYGLDHSGPSYEVRVYFDRPDAVVETGDGTGFVGRFALLGHGGCFGEDGHCQVTEPVSAFDRTHPHQLVPATRILTVTEQVKALVTAGAQSVQVTAVAVVRESALSTAGQSAEVLVIDQVALHIFD